MPRDNLCTSCNGMFDDDEMEEQFTCVYCYCGVDSGFGDHEEEEYDEDHEDRIP